MRSVKSSLMPIFYPISDLTPFHFFLYKINNTHTITWLGEPLTRCACHVGNLKLSPGHCIIKHIDCNENRWKIFRNNILRWFSSMDEWSRLCRWAWFSSVRVISECFTHTHTHTRTHTHTHTRLVYSNGWVITSCAVNYGWTWTKAYASVIAFAISTWLVYRRHKTWLDVFWRRNLIWQAVSCQCDCVAFLVWVMEPLCEECCSFSRCIVDVCGPRSGLLVYTQSLQPSASNLTQHQYHAYNRWFSIIFCFNFFRAFPQLTVCRTDRSQTGVESSANNDCSGKRYPTFTHQLSCVVSRPACRRHGLYYNK